MAEFRIGSQSGEVIQNADTINNYPHSSRDNYALGIRSIHAQHYRRAVSYLQSALDVDPSDQDLHYYYALALLQGVRPSRQARVNIIEIRRHLHEAGDRPHGLVLTALVNEDYSLAWQNYSAVPPDLVRLVQSVDPMHCREIIQHVPAPEARTWRELMRKVK